MSKLGSIIKKFRLSKGITQSELSEDILSVTGLSKFERELNDISSEKFMKIIDRLNISLHEVNIFLTEFENSNQRQFLLKLSLAENEDNLSLLDKLYAEQVELFKASKNIRHKHNAIIVSQTVNSIKNESFNKVEVNQICKYLQKIENWNYYEISLFSNAIFFLPLEYVIYFSNYMIQKTIKYSESTIYKKDICILMSNIVLTLIEQNELNEAQHVSQILKQYLENTTFYYEILRLQFLEGLLLIKQNKSESGTSICEKSIESMDALGDYSNSRAYRKYLLEFTND